jgi:hypothetical protein
VLVLRQRTIARIYTDDPAVLEVATTLLLLAGLFQVSDGLQLGCSGALRGYQDARIPLAITVVSYWGIGFTLAWLFGIVRGGGAPGVWLGLIAGLTAAALLLAAIFAVSVRTSTPGRIPRTVLERLHDLVSRWSDRPCINRSATRHEPPVAEITAPWVASAQVRVCHRHG